MQTASAIKAAGGEALVVAGDVTAEDFPAKIMKATAEAFGTIDILINNAGEPSDSEVLWQKISKLTITWISGLTCVGYKVSPC